MFVSSLLGLIVAQYVNHLISISSLFQEYYRSYYYAYGWLELGLAQAKHHGYGFEQWVGTDFIFTDYDSCTALSGGFCNANITVQSRWNPVADSYADWADCAAMAADGGTDHVDYSLSAGDAIILPLFRDTSSGFDPVSYSVLWFTGLQAMAPRMEASTTGDPTQSYIIKVVDEDLINYNITLEPTVAESPYAFATWLGEYDSSVDNKNYLVIANASGDVKDFCIELAGTNRIVSKYILIDSVGTYGDSVASLSALKVDQLPSFLGYGTINSR